MDKLKLEYHIKTKGLTIGQVCKRLGISRSAFYRKCNGFSEFTLPEIQQLIDLLELDSPVGVFFADKVS